MSKKSSKYKVRPAQPPHKLVIVNGKQAGKMPTHIRRIRQQPPPSTPPDLPTAA